MQDVLDMALLPPEAEVGSEGGKPSGVTQEPAREIPVRRRAPASPTPRA
jgi:hypothetical protein